MKLAEKKNDKDFVNLHQTDRKRKFRDLQNSTIESTNAYNTVFNRNSDENLKNPKNSCLNTSLAVDSGRKILSLKSPKSQLSSNSTSTSYVLSDGELEKLINDVSVMGSREEIKDYLRGKISNLIGNTYLLICFF